MRSSYVRLMQTLHWACIAWCSVAIVCMTALIFTGVVMRYGFAVGARFAEPMSIFFAVQLTMYGAAACYRAHVHLRLLVFVKMLPGTAQRGAELLVQLLLGGVAVLMIVYGASLTETTWFQAYPEFDYVKVGLVYSAIPGSGAVMLLFVVESLLFRRDGGPEDRTLEEALDQAEHERQRFAASGAGRRPGLS